MDHSTFDWIGQYLDWTQPDGWAVGAHRLAASGPAQPSAEAGRAFVAAYLDWMDGCEPVRPAPSPYRAAARHSVRRNGDLTGLDVFEEVLLAALRTQSDCLQMLRGVLDAGKSPPPMVQFAARTLAHAERLLEDERRAWRYVAALRHYGFSHSRAARDETAWPHALEEVAAQVHALQGSVLAMQRH